MTQANEEKPTPMLGSSDSGLPGLSVVKLKVALWYRTFVM